MIFIIVCLAILENYKKITETELSDLCDFPRLNGLN